MNCALTGPSLNRLPGRRLVEGGTERRLAPSCSITIIDGTRLTEERARVARGTDALALASLGAITLFFIAAGLVAIAMGA